MPSPGNTRLGTGFSTGLGAGAEVGAVTLVHKATGEGEDLADLPPGLVR